MAGSPGLVPHVLIGQRRKYALVRVLYVVMTTPHPHVNMTSTRRTELTLEWSRRMPVAHRPPARPSKWRQQRYCCHCECDLFWLLFVFTESLIICCIFERPFSAAIISIWCDIICLLLNTSEYFNSYVNAINFFSITRPTCSVYPIQVRRVDFVKVRGFPLSKRTLCAHLSVCSLLNLRHKWGLLFLFKTRHGQLLQWFFFPTVFIHFRYSIIVIIFFLGTYRNFFKKCYGLICMQPDFRMACCPDERWSWRTAKKKNRCKEETGEKASHRYVHFARLKI